MKNYVSNRNETTRYNYQSQYYYGSIDQYYIDVEMIIKIPMMQEVAYIPYEFEILKFAWIDYFSMFILVYFVIYELFFAFIIKNKVFDCIDADYGLIQKFKAKKVIK